jgi:hypothetical protein
MPCLAAGSEGTALILTQAWFGLGDKGMGYITCSLKLRIHGLLDWCKPSDARSSEGEHCFTASLLTPATQYSVYCCATAS